MDDQQEQRTTEVRETEFSDGGAHVQRQTVRTDAAVGGSTIAKRIVWYIAAVIMIFLAARVILLLMGANQGSGFVDFVYSIGGFFAAPFFGMFSYTPEYGVSVFELGSVVGIAVYALVAWAITALFGLTRRRDEV